MCLTSGKLWGKILAVVLILLVGLGAGIHFFVNFNNFKPHISEFFQQKTGLNMEIAGDIKLKLVPGGSYLQISDVKLFMTKTGDSFASIPSIRVNVSLRPLLHKQLVIKEVVLDGAELEVSDHIFLDAIGSVLHKVWQDDAKATSGSPTSMRGTAKQNVDKKDGGTSLFSTSLKKLTISGAKLKHYSPNGTVNISEKLDVSFAIPSDAQPSLVLHSSYITDNVPTELDITLANFLTVFHDKSLDKDGLLFAIVQSSAASHFSWSGNVKLDEEKSIITLKDSQLSTDQLSISGDLVVGYQNEALTQVTGDLKLKALDGGRILAAYQAMTIIPSVPSDVALISTDSTWSKLEGYAYYLFKQPAPIDVKLAIEQFTYNNLKLDNVNAYIACRDHRLFLKLDKFNIYGGDGTLTVNVDDDANKAYGVYMSLGIQNTDVGQLLRTVAGYADLDAKMVYNFNAKANYDKDFVKFLHTLDGRGSFDIKEGTIRNLHAILPDDLSTFAKVMQDQIVFDEFKGGMSLSGGQLHVDDLLLSSQANEARSSILTLDLTSHSVNGNITVSKFAYSDILASLGYKVPLTIGVNGTLQDPKFTMPSGQNSPLGNVAGATTQNEVDKNVANNVSNKVKKVVNN